MAALRMQGERRWKEREDVMYQPACAHISDDYLHGGFTVGPGPGGDHVQDPVSNLGWHSRRF